MKAKDKRIRTTNELLAGIKVLKLYSWEKSFEEKVTVCNYVHVVYIRIVCFHLQIPKTPKCMLVAKVTALYIYIYMCVYMYMYVTGGKIS